MCVRFAIPSFVLLLFLFPFAADLRADDLSSLGPAEITYGVGALAYTVDGVSPFDPEKMPDEFERKIKNPAYDTKFTPKEPKKFTVKFKKVPCPGGAPGVCYMMDVYKPCGLFGLSLCYMGSAIIRIDSSSGLYVYDIDGTYLWGYWYEGDFLCMTTDGGQTVVCYEKRCFGRLLPTPENPFSSPVITNPLIPQEDSSSGAKEGTDAGDMCPGYPFGGGISDEILPAMPMSGAVG